MTPTFACVPGGQGRGVGDGRGGRVGGGAVHLIEGAVGEALLFVTRAQEAGQGELVMGRQAGRVAEALRPRGAVLLYGARLDGQIERGGEGEREKKK